MGSSARLAREAQLLVCRLDAELRHFRHVDPVPRDGVESHDRVEPLETKTFSTLLSPFQVLFLASFPCFSTLFLPS